MSPRKSERLYQIREHVENAHREVQAAQKLAYSRDWTIGPPASWRIRMALNKAQSILIKLLVHQLPSKK